MVNKLRIVSDNIVNRVNGSETAKSMNDYKSQYDTGSVFTANIDYSVDGNATYAIVCYLADNPGSLALTLKWTQYNSQISYHTGAIPYSNLNMNIPVGYGSGGYFVAYLPGYLINNRGDITLEFNTQIKLSKLMIGKCWTPRYNANYGASVGYTDMTSVERLQGGDQLAVIGPRHKTLRFDLQYVHEDDKYYLLDLAKLIGRSTPIFISVFPEDADYTKEQMYSIIGRLITPPNISNTMYSMYATSIEIEEL